MSNKKDKKNKYNKGAAMLIAVIFFLFTSMTIVFGIISPILKQATISKEVVFSKESYYLAEGALEDAVYRLKTGKTVSSGDTVVLNGYTATINVISTSEGKTINAVSDRAGIIRKMQSSVTTGVGTAFNYGIQTGTGGFNLSGGSRVNGNVYSNGDIIATNGVTITGSAIAANSSALSSDQLNDTPTPPTNNIKFRDTSTTQDLAQSFQVTNQGPINKVSLYIKKTGSPSDITVRMVTNSSGNPSTTNLFTTQGTLSASLVSINYGWVDVVFPDNPELIPGTTYWLVLDNSTQSSTNYYTIGGNSSYTNGSAKLGKYAGTWNNTNPVGLDGYFRIYLGGLTSTIGGGTYVGAVVIGSGGVGDAYAHNVTGAQVAGNLYCQTGDDNNKSCDTSRPDPSPTGYPISDSNIADWKSEASAGGTITGNYTVGWAGATVGPTKITGNLVVNGGGTLTLSGTIWVQGTITLSGGGKIKLAASYGTKSGVLLSDNIVSLAGGGNLSGSGQAGSYLMVLTTSNCPIDSSCGGVDALTLSGGAGAVILSAQRGTMTLNGGSGVKAATAYLIKASGGAIINYESGLADVNFSSGPSGGWSISSWEEVE
ncbi:MAG: choice-of-anchor R domain-containing protein [Candidatus Paceibacterota bacterium]|jgi:hypothetical protein